jgi:hypothetical protein
MRPLVLIAAGLFVMFGLPDVSALRDWLPVAVVRTSEVDRVVAVYDHNGKRHSSDVRAAISAIDASGIEADFYEVGGTDGTGVVAEEYKLAEAAAVKHGMPCVVYLAGGQVLRVVTADTKESVMEAVK